jgi:hypothetical protein
LKVSPTLVTRLSKSNFVASVSWDYSFVNGDTGEIIVYGLHSNYFVYTPQNVMFARFFLPFCYLLSSWEKAMGSYVRGYQSQWENNLGGALDISLSGISCLESVYVEYGALDIDNVKQMCSNSQN